MFLFHSFFTILSIRTVRILIFHPSFPVLLILLLLFNRRFDLSISTIVFFLWFRIWSFRIRRSNTGVSLACIFFFLQLSWIIPFAEFPFFLNTHNFITFRLLDLSTTLFTLLLALTCFTHDVIAVYSLNLLRFIFLTKCFIQSGLRFS